MTGYSDYDLMYESALCRNYSDNRCRSCELFGIARAQRVKYKTERLLALCREFGLSDELVKELWIPSNPLQSRYKVKTAVGGTVDKPILGFVDDSREVRELIDCPLLHPHLNSLLSVIEGIIREFKLVPYDIEQRCGELKYVIAILNPQATEGIVRFVTRSTESHSRVRKAVSTLVTKLPWVSVVSLNLQSQPAALLEGREETILTERSSIHCDVGAFHLYVGPQSFMQVTPEAATALYSHVRRRAESIRPERVLDLFCGVGGFAFACAPYSDSVLGIEISENAIQCARQGAERNRLSNCSFQVGDATQVELLVAGFNPDFIVVNPPRGGLRDATLRLIQETCASTVLYSSCNPDTLFRDLKFLEQAYSVTSVAPFDMFPMTKHLEVVVELRRRERPDQIT